MKGSFPRLGTCYPNSFVTENHMLPSAITSASHPLSSHPSKPENTTTTVLCSGMEFFPLPQIWCAECCVQLSRGLTHVRNTCDQDSNASLQDRLSKAPANKLQNGDECGKIHQGEFDTQSCSVHALRLIVNTHMVLFQLFLNANFLACLSK